MMRAQRPSPLVAALHRAPEFLILGAQKAGTTSLHDHLCSHPQVVPALEKEVHFFDNNYARGADWYFRRFPSWPARLRRWARTGRWPISGEATPMYLFHPLVPERIAALLPAARLIVLLRDPVLRAYSHYQHNVRAGWESLPFPDAIASEQARVVPALEALARDPLDVDTRLHAYSYRARGRYLEQLVRYEALFPRDRLLVLCSEEFFSDPGPTYGKVLNFLGLPAFAPRFLPSNQGGYAQAPASAARTLDELCAYFAPHNEALFDHLGRRFPWG